MVLVIDSGVEDVVDLCGQTEQVFADLLIKMCLLVQENGTIPSCSSPTISAFTIRTFTNSFANS